MATAAEFLLRTQNPDGGWGYRSRGMSYVEPTACVLLALSKTVATADSSLNQSRERGLGFLGSLQHTDGGWGVGAIDTESGWMTAWAVYSLAALQANNSALERGVGWLLASQDVWATSEQDRQQMRQLFHIDSTLIGFPWRPGDASWVYPTALSLLALCAAGKAQAPKSRQAIAFLLDRAVDSGGWNFGNPEMVGEPMAATVQDTALSVLALRAAGERSDSRIGQALEFLTQAVQSTTVTSDLTWGAYALEDWQVDARDAKSRLAAKQGDDGGWGGNPFVTAVALLAGIQERVR